MISRRRCVNSSYSSLLLASSFCPPSSSHPPTLAYSCIAVPHLSCLTLPHLPSLACPSFCTPFTCNAALYLFTCSLDAACLYSLGSLVSSSSISPPSLHLSPLVSHLRFVFTLCPPSPHSILIVHILLSSFIANRSLDLRLPDSVVR